MEYIWEPVIECRKQEKDEKNLHFCVQNNRVSPYMELQTDSIYEKLNEKRMDTYLDVNPYIRFGKFFDFITSDDLGYNELNRELADTTLHFLADLDIKSGLCKRELYIKFLLKALEDEVFGSYPILNQFRRMKKRNLAEEMLTLYETGDYFTCFIRLIKKWYPFCELYIRAGEEIVFYMREPNNQIQKEKIDLICDLFLPLPFSYVIHWEKTYGVIGHEDTMRLEEFIL
ncbi:hypothetical protein [Velocimicrobium porci]|uniref:Iron-dependent peroxidase n=1 Tax=Velocimicrobium porci TaxID=2606634 RepID=A0A6L5Y2P9_9FIRM|nr:hypothetical protein [Velocimicrobium porci]MSS64393.1 hypothetical protein [Velocimicrobium porci]